LFCCPLLFPRNLDRGMLFVLQRLTSQALDDTSPI
jgi:hypothetical protein